MHRNTRDIYLKYDFVNYKENQRDDLIASLTVNFKIEMYI